MGRKFAGTGEKSAGFRITQFANQLECARGSHWDWDLKTSSGKKTDHVHFMKHDMVFCFYLESFEIFCSVLYPNFLTHISAFLGGLPCICDHLALHSWPLTEWCGASALRPEHASSKGITHSPALRPHVSGSWCRKMRHISTFLKISSCYYPWNYLCGNYISEFGLQSQGPQSSELTKRGLLNIFSFKLQDGSEWT